MKKEKILSLMLTFILIISLAGCAAGDRKSSIEEKDTKDMKVAFLCNGTLGDGSFFDDAADGIKKIHDELGIETKIVESGYDKAKWQPALEDLSDEDYDIIIVGTWDMVEILETVAEQNPDQKYILFDSSMNYEDGKFPNVYSVEYRYNEGSFLAGVLAAKVTSASMEYSNPEKVIGFVGGIESPVINDFLVGYIEGAQYVDPKIKVAVSYIGDFSNSTKGKEMATAQYNGQRADIFMGAAGQAGLGVLDAAKECGAYAIGMSSDQSAMYKESDPVKSKLILTSQLTALDISLFHSVERAIEGDLPWGSAESQGIKEDVIKLADNEVYQSMPDEVKEAIEAALEDVKSDKITVSTAIGMENAEVQKIIESAAP